MDTVILDNFDSIYRALLLEVYYRPTFKVTVRKVPSYELLNVSFVLTDPTRALLLNSHARNLNVTYATAFAAYCLNGGENIDELVKLNPAAARYISPKNLSDRRYIVNYGVRIKDQLEAVINELKRDPGSRRAVIQILQPTDVIIRDTPNVTAEYPCASTIQFLIRDEKLVCIVNMRSQHIALTLCYDVYNFTQVMLHVASMLALPVGNYYHNMTSAHVFEKDFPLINQILDEKVR